MAPLTRYAEEMRHTLADAPTFQLRLEDATPEEREQVVKLHSALLDLLLPIKARLDALDVHAKRAFIDSQASELPMTGGRSLRFTPPDGSYSVQPAEMRRKLLEYVPAKLTQAEVDDAVKVLTTYEVNHTKLNYLAKHRGEEVATIIAAHRERVEPPMERGRVKWPDPIKE